MPPTGAPSCCTSSPKGHDAAVAAEHAEVEETIAGLWNEYREARVRGRFGDRDVIIKRARLEERLDRAALGTRASANPCRRYPGREAPERGPSAP